MSCPPAGLSPDELGWAHTLAELPPEWPKVYLRIRVSTGGSLSKQGG